MSAAPVEPALTTADLAALLDRAAPGADYLAAKLRGESDKTADRAAREATAPHPETTFNRQPNGMLTATPPDNAAAFAAPHARSATPEPEKPGEDEGNCVICGKPRRECRRDSLAAGRTISIDAYAPTTKVGED